MRLRADRTRWGTGGFPIAPASSGEGARILVEVRRSQIIGPPNW